MIGYGILLIIGAIVCIAILFFSGRVTWRFYQSADIVNRLMLRIFVWGVFWLLLTAIATQAGILPLEKSAILSFMATVGWIACGALGVLIAREMWSFLNKARMANAFRTPEEPE